MDACGGWGDGAFSGDVPVANGIVPPPFLGKTYDMVDDPSTDSIVSWVPGKSAFVVWNTAMFARDLLPKYFKHNNFSSFVRQLNTYGFKKIDPDRWEFANDRFLKGQKHLLTNISRKKCSHMHNQQLQPLHQNPPIASFVEVGKFGLDEEIEILKRDKNVLMQELVRLRQQQQTTDSQLLSVTECLLGMEQRQQQMMSFFAKAMHRPEFFAQLMQQNNADNHIFPGRKKRKFPNQVELEGESPSSDGLIISHQSFNSMHLQKQSSDKSPSSDTLIKPEGITHHRNYNFPDCSTVSISMSEVALQDASLSMRMPNVLASSGISAACSCSSLSELQSTPVHSDNCKNILSTGIGFQEFSPEQGVLANESNAEILSLDFLASEAETIPFSPLVGVDGLIPVELENFSGDARIDDASSGMKLPLAVSLWEQLISDGQILGVTEDVGSC